MKLANTCLPACKNIYLPAAGLDMGSVMRHDNCCRSGTPWETAFTMPLLRKQRKSCRKVCSLCHCKDA